MEFKDLVEKMTSLGFSNYEARAYISLCKRHPSTGYELAKSSGIPPSKIYEVLGKLLERSMISQLAGKPIKYLPQDIRVFLKNIRNSFQESVGYLEKYLPTLVSTDFNYVYNVVDMAECLHRAKEMIVGAVETIIILGWDQELLELMHELKLSKLEHIAIIQFGSMPIDVGVVYNHGIEKVLEREKGGRIFSLVTDASSLVQGIISETGQVRGIYTSHPSLVELAMDYMKHEIYTTKMYDLFAQEMDTKFGGKHLPKLRDIWKKYDV